MGMRGVEAEGVSLFESTRNLVDRDDHRSSKTVNEFFSVVIRYPATSVYLDNRVTGDSAGQFAVEDCSEGRLKPKGAQTSSFDRIVNMSWVFVLA